MYIGINSSIALFSHCHYLAHLDINLDKTQDRNILTLKTLMFLPSLLHLHLTHTQTQTQGVEEKMGMN